MSTVTTTNGSNPQAGQTLFAVNGRPAITEDGSVQFFRSLTLGDQGEDVLQLKKILATAGDDPGPMNNYFNQQTQFALAQWQAQNHYPNSTPATTQAVTVALTQGTGYKLGNQDSAGLVIGPPAAQTTAGPRHRHRQGQAVTVTRARRNGLGRRRAGDRHTGPHHPIRRPTGRPGAAGPVRDHLVERLGHTDHRQPDRRRNSRPGVVTPPPSVTLAAGATQASVSVQTRATTAVAANQTIVLSIAGGTGYTVGTPGSAQTTIKNDNVPALRSPAARP